MGARATKFSVFSDGLYPSEVAYVLVHNDFQDADYFKILERMAARIAPGGKEVQFDSRIDPRKYSRLKQAFENKLNAIDVDAYYQWISHINYLIHTDAIPPDEQSRILSEVGTYHSAWFHAASFYDAMQAYESYLLIRYREKDLQAIQQFLQKHREAYLHNEHVLGEVKLLTEKVVRAPEALHALSAEELRTLYTYFTNTALSKKTRYQAWLAFHLYHVNARQPEAMVEPMEVLEKQIFEGGFYSRRILANFYANKLLMLSKLHHYEKAVYCGEQSIKHRTEDYLYYLNNHCSVLMHLQRFEEALQLMKTAFGIQKSTLDRGRRLVFIANYCRALNAVGDYRQSVRMSRSFLDEVEMNVFKYRWQYFFRAYLLALLRMGQADVVLRLERKYRLKEREMAAGRIPQLSLIAACAEFQELRITEQAFRALIEAAGAQPEFKEQEALESLRKEFATWL